RKLHAVHVAIVFKVGLLWDYPNHCLGVTDAAQQQTSLSIKEEPLAMIVGGSAADDQNISIADLVLATQAKRREFVPEFDIAVGPKHRLHLVEHRIDELYNSAWTFFPCELAIEAAFARPLGRVHAEVELIRRGQVSLERY